MPTADHDLIAHLNAALTCKLTGINQYFLHARILKHQGKVRLADDEYKASIDAMKHADMLVEQVLRLGGIPNLQELGQLMIGTTEGEMLRGDLALTESTLTQVEAAAACSEQLKDKATSALLGRILDGLRERTESLRQHINSNLKDCA